VIHGSLLTAVQLHPALAVTATVPLAPIDAANVDDSGEMAETHDGAACVTVKLWPAIVRVPVRVADPVLAATLYVTVPLPLPLAPAPTVSHAALLVAVQLQPLAAVTVTVPVAADETKLAALDERLNVHATPACVTVKVWPPMIIVPVRDVADVLAATLYVTVPLPLPLAPAATVSHAALLVAVQPQPLPAVTVTVPVVADETTLAVLDERLNVHGAPGWVTVKVWPPTVIVPVRAAVDVLAATV